MTKKIYPYDGCTDCEDHHECDGAAEKHCPELCDEETPLEVDEDTATERGFRVLRFPDRSGDTCSLQKSSIATEDCVWFGADDANPQMFVPHGNPLWRPMPLPKLPDGGTFLFSTRMHLSRKQVEQLLPHLQHFAETGELPTPCGGCGEVTCQWCQHEIDKAVGIDR